MGWLDFWLTLVLLAFAVVLFWLFRYGRKIRRQEAEKVEAHREFVAGVFAEIKKCFKAHGLTFVWAIDYYEKYGGQTVPTSSGVYINIRHYYEDVYIIELERQDDGVSSHEKQARRDIHRHLESELIDNRSPNSRYFKKWGLSELKEDGIELVVASFVGALEEYSRIWADLEVLRVGEEIATALKFHVDNNVRLMRRVDFVIGQYLPARKETVAS